MLYWTESKREDKIAVDSIATFPVRSDLDWYHGEKTRDEAEQALKASGCDCFLIRHSQRDLILSLIQHGKILHCLITYRPGRYELKGSSRIFNDLQELVAHYHKQFDLSGILCEKNTITPGKL